MGNTVSTSRHRSMLAILFELHVISRWCPPVSLPDVYCFGQFQAFGEPQPWERTCSQRSTCCREAAYKAPQAIGRVHEATKRRLSRPFLIVASPAIITARGHSKWYYPIQTLTGSNIINFIHTWLQINWAVKIDRSTSDNKWIPQRIPSKLQQGIRPPHHARQLHQPGIASLTRFLVQVCVSIAPHRFDAFSGSLPCDLPYNNHTRACNRESQSFTTRLLNYKWKST